MSVNSFPQQTNRGAVAKITLMESDFTEVFICLVKSFSYLFIIISYYLLVARHQQLHDVDRIGT
jgi:hypothetical protein